MGQFVEKCVNCGRVISMGKCVGPNEDRWGVCNGCESKPALKPGPTRKGGRKMKLWITKDKNTIFKSGDIVTYSYELCTWCDEDRSAFSQKNNLIFIRPVYLSPLKEWIVKLLIR